jgi:nucleoside-diphosphate-sugar epimerase
MASPPRLLVIGKNSFLAREFLASNSDLSFQAIGHGDAHRDSLYEGASCVVNFAFSPQLYDSEYDASVDVDRVAAHRALSHGIHYVMISSRRVYSETVQWDAEEGMEACGRDAYGRNKARIERALQDSNGERLTILRPGSVVGLEAIPGRMRIAAYMQNQLLDEGQIRLTLAARTRRDLVPVDFFSRVLRHIAQARVSGVFNVGSGAATTVGQAAQWLIEGHGSGELIEVDTRVTDEFQLDSSKLKRTFGLACDPGELKRCLLEYGANLARNRRNRNERA